MRQRTERLHSLLPHSLLTNSSSSICSSCTRSGTTADARIRITKERERAAAAAGFSCVRRRRRPDCRPVTTTTAVTAAAEAAAATATEQNRTEQNCSSACQGRRGTDEHILPIPFVPSYHCLSGRVLVKFCFIIPPLVLLQTLHLNLHCDNSVLRICFSLPHSHRLHCCRENRIRRGETEAESSVSLSLSLIFCCERKRKEYISHPHFPHL